MDGNYLLNATVQKKEFPKATCFDFCMTIVGCRGAMVIGSKCHITRYRVKLERRVGFNALLVFNQCPGTYVT